MAIALNPAVAQLGITAPVLGPWFDVNLVLPAPSPQLGLTATLNVGASWLPPATGTLSLYIADPVNVPAALAGLA